MGFYRFITNISSHTFQVFLDRRVPTVAPIWASSIEIRNNYRLGIIQRSKYGEKITLELKDDGKTKKVERLIFGWS